ncbi:MAG: 5-formyltetrahydrofolate cyclo-ligase [Nitrososphaeraceae archaeon]|nr:5-formyltetrahydrofolate cyclo-ligase [Nitrososphaeraceae archaeon]
MSPINPKEIIRKNVLEIRNQLSDIDIIKFSKIINKKIITSKEFKNANCIGIYYPIGSEVQTFDIIRESLLMNKQIGLPRVINSEIIKFYLILEKSLGQIKLTKEKYGVMINSDSNVDLESIDLLLIPGVAFDKKCNRIGYGKGFYDKYIQTTNQAKKIGLAFQKQIVEQIPINKHDKKLDLIVTEKNNYYYKTN